MAKITTSDFQKGMFIEFRSQPHQIVEFQFVNPGKGSAFVRTKLKGVKSDKVLEFTYKSGETVEEIPVNVREMQFLYKAENKLVFMDKESYEQITIDKSLIGNLSQFLKEGEIYQIFVHEGEALGMRSPKKVKLLVTEAEEGVKGNTVTGGRKTVILETGVVVSVPLFIKKGDIVAVDPESGEYQERVSQT
jgi:elongation factor P